MLKKKFMVFIVSALMFCTVSVSQAQIAPNNIYLNVVTPVVNLGDQAIVELWMDFTESTLGGSMDMFYNPALLSPVQFPYNDIDPFTGIVYSGNSSFVFSPLSTLIPGDGIAFRARPTENIGELDGIGIGAFFGINPGNQLIGTVTFDTLALGMAEISVLPDAPFFNVAGDTELLVGYGGPVPEPATLSLLLLGGLGLAGISKKKKSNT